MAAQQEWVSIGQRVREARSAAQLSQEELGRRLGLDRTMIAKIEAGTRRIDAVELVRLATSLDLPIDHLLHERPAVLSRRASLQEGTSGRDAFRLEVALTSWLRDVRQLQALGVLEPHPLLVFPGSVDSAATARQAADWLRERLELGSGPIDSMVQACQDTGLYVAVTDLPGDGASVRDDDLAVAVVRRQGDPGRRRATAAHELGHLVLGDEYSSDLGVHASRAGREAVIDAFAAEFLLPATVIAAVGREFGREALIRLASEYRTSWTLAVRQAVRSQVLDRGDAMSWLRRTPTRTELLDATGWTPQPDLEWIRVPAAYAHAVLRARAEHFITTARAVDMMRGQVEEADFPPRGDEELPP
ncbi:helix-turn-helix domain-containing protein [Actinoplanes sp. CA-131856]